MPIFSAGNCLRWICLLLALSAGLSAAAENAAPRARGVVLADFESGSVVLQSYDEEDQDPSDWELDSENTYGGSSYALRLWGNTWKELALAPTPLAAGSVIEAALYVEELGELQAIGFADESDNVLFYCVAGSQLVLTDRWNVVYQGAFPRGEWHAYRVPLAQDWFDTWGYLPELTRIVFVNDRDGTSRGVTLFDEIRDVTDEVPIAPRIEIQAFAGDAVRVTEADSPGAELYRVEVQFQALLHDPDSDTHAYRWDFGDGAESDLAAPTHSFTATADYTFTVSLDVTDEAGLFGRDTCQVVVEPSGQLTEFTVNFTGDVFTGRAYEQPGGLIDTYGIEYLWEPTLGLLGQAADVTVINAECAFTDRGEPHPTKSVVFRTRPENIDGLLYAGVEVATLGNNHIVDYGLEGLLQTHEIMDSVGIGHAGSGITDYFALQPVYVTLEGVRLAVYSACNRTGRQYNEQPFLDAGYEKCGLGYWLEPNNERALAQADSLADIVIACPHSGIEYDFSIPDRNDGLPAPQIDLARFDIENCPPFTPEAQAPDVRFRIWPGLGDRQLRQQAIDLGADAVINNHPHVLQPFESYQGRLIAHSLGNFMFDLSYAETLPTLVLTARMDKERIRGWSCAPVFIDRYVPRPATGRLGREILDRQADWSRPFGALLGVDPQSLTARVYLDPGQFYPELATQSAASPWRDLGGESVCAPIPLAGQGSLARLVEASGIEGAAEVRVGREVLWFGDFEPSEGYRMWNLNSGDEWLDDETPFHGEYVLALHRDDHDPENVVTLLDRHLPAADSLCYGIAGWMRTENAEQADFSLRLYSSRYSWNQLETLYMGDSVDGTTDWTWYAADFEPVPNGAYFNVRCNLGTPNDGDAYAWFDDLRVIEWQPWQPLELPLEVACPNNYRFVQVRTTAPGDSAHLVYEEASLVDAGYSATPPSAPADAPCARLLGARPNPVRGAALIAYELAQPAPVDLAVYDVGGRLVTRLARGERQSAGRHAVAWQPSHLASGLYFVKLEAGGERHTARLVLVR